MIGLESGSALLAESGGSLLLESDSGLTTLARLPDPTRARMATSGPGIDPTQAKAKRSSGLPDPARARVVAASPTIDPAQAKAKRL